MKKFATIASLVLLISLLPTASAQDVDGEKLFREMERKIETAKAFEMTFQYQLQGKTTKGSLLLTEDNKTRLKLNGPFHFGGKKNASFELVSDGKKYQTVGAKLVVASNGMAGFDDGQSDGDLSKTFHKILAANVSRGGVATLVIALPYFVNTEFDPNGEESKMKVYDFKAGNSERVGLRKATPVSYRYGSGGNDDAEVTVWIDAQTNLPLKRVLSLPRGEKLRFTESYSAFQVNPKIGEDAFKLPR